MKKALKVLLGLTLILGALLSVTYFSLKAMWADTADRAPEAATGIRDVQMVQTSTTMVVAAHPLAAKAGHLILQRGGSAMDAAVAVQAALTVVEPQSSGIGGGAFLLYWDASEKKLYAYDGRETAPDKATPELFMNEDGTPFNFVEAVVGGRSVGVPGVLRTLSLAHDKHGTKGWNELFTSAIGLADNGFEITPRLYKLLHKDALFRAMPGARAHFYDQDGAAKTVGTRLRNPALAHVLSEVANDVDAFYTGPIAEDIVEAVASAKRPSTLHATLNTALLEMGAPSGTGWTASEDNAGLLSLEDLKNYTPEVREPVCVPFQGYRVCGFPPPTSGGITTLQIIAMMDRHDLKSITPRSPEFAHLFAEASRLAFADRGQFIADPKFVDVPVEGLLAPEYLDARAALFSRTARAKQARPGSPEGSTKTALRFSPDESPELPCTSHFVIKDANGNVVSMTTSVENVFGSRLVVHGFVLNNQLTDFSFVPERDGKPIANAVAAHKRPRSSMSPLIVFDKDGEVALAIGSPGGSRIIDFTAQATIGILAYGLTPQTAVELPHVINRGGVTELENTGWKEGELEAAKAYLQSLGHEVRVAEENSGLHALQIHEGAVRSGVDPRREGAAYGR